MHLLSVTRAELKQLLLQPRGGAASVLHLSDLLSETTRAALETLGKGGPCLVTCQLTDRSRISLVGLVSRQKLELDLEKEVRDYYLFLLGEDL